MFSAGTANISYFQFKAVVRYLCEAARFRHTVAALLTFLLLSGCGTVRSSDYVSEPAASTAALPVPVTNIPAVGPAPVVPAPVSGTTAAPGAATLPKKVNGGAKEKGPRTPAATPAASTPPADTDTDLVDQALARLKTGQIVFDAPTTMDYYETGTVRLQISGNKAIATVQRNEQINRQYIVAEVKISNKMESHLEGQGFAISPITDETQDVTSDLTEWRWEISPKAKGLQKLHLTISAYVKVNGESGTRVVKILDKNVTIYVTTWQSILDFILNNWQWLWAVVIVPLAALIWHKRKKMRTWIRKILHRA